MGSRPSKMNPVDRLRVQRVTRESRTDIEDSVVRELALSIVLGDRELVSLLCSPSDLDLLAVGFLFSEGLLGSKDEIQEITVDRRRRVVRVKTTAPANSSLPSKRVITSGRGATFRSDARGLPKVRSELLVPVESVFRLVHDFQHHSLLYRTTGGVHSAALCDTSGILCSAEDIGRHNAIDKVFGHCLLNDVPTEDRIVITSGRVSSEILLKVARRRVPVLISVSAPTDAGVKLANALEVTLVGFVRGGRMNVYAGEWRIV